MSFLFVFICVVLFQFSCNKCLQTSFLPRIKVRDKLQQESSTFSVFLHSMPLDSRLRGNDNHLLISNFFGDEPFVLISGLNLRESE